MAQPAQLPRFADTVYADPTRVVQPTSGKADVGWSEGERPAAEHMNWLMATIYFWCLYLKNLKDEAFGWTAAHTFGAGIGVTGNVTASGAVQAATLHSTGASNIDGAATVGGNLNLTGNAFINGTVNAGGAVTLSSTLHASGSIDTSQSLVASVSVVAPVGTFSGALTAASGTFSGAVSGTTGTFSGVVSGTDLKFSGGHTRVVSAAAGSSQSSNTGVDNWTRGSFSGTPIPHEIGLPLFVLSTAPSSDNVTLPLHVENGETIVSWSIDMENNDGASALNAVLRRTDGLASATVDTLSITSGSGRSLPSSTINHAVISDEAYYINVAAATGGSVSANTMIVYKAKIVVKRV